MDIDPGHNNTILPVVVMFVDFGDTCLRRCVAGVSQVLTMAMLTVLVTAWWVTNVTMSCQHDNVPISGRSGH